MPSSAYNNTNKFIKPMSMPVDPLFLVKSSKSFTYIEKRKGERLSPCQTPNIHSKESVIDFGPLTLDLSGE